jgi:epoxyqueuosine reductase
MKPDADRRWILERAQTLGFDLCGIVQVEKFPELQKYQEWLDRGYAGEMKYLADPRRTDPSLLMPGLRSAIVCALNYNTPHPYSFEAGATDEPTDKLPRGWISRYAWGEDYHQVMWDKLNALAHALNEKFPKPFVARAYADTGPVAERVFAKYAGIGWLGKNTLLLNKSYGSWLFLGVIFTTLVLEPSLEPGESPPPDLCGSCRKCLDACPTDALVEPHVLDARRCISYLTIEHRGSIREEFREAMGKNVYGCDICQDVCPYNRQAPVSSSPEFEPRYQGSKRSLLEPSLEWLAEMDEAEYREVFRDSSMKRAKWAGLVRNACLALGNAGEGAETSARGRIQDLLAHRAGEEISTVSESATWALTRIEGKPK